MSITSEEAQPSSRLQRLFQPYTTYANSAIAKLLELGVSGKGRALFDLLCQYSDKKTHVARIHPTQLSKELGCHKSTVYRHLNSFKEAGLIDFDGEMEVIDKSRGFLRIREVTLLLDGAGYIIKKEQPKTEEKPKENGGVAGMRQNCRNFANLYNRTSETTYIHKGINNNSIQFKPQEHVVVKNYSFSYSQQEQATNVATTENPKSVQNAPNLKVKDLEVADAPKQQKEQWYSLADNQPEPEEQYSVPSTEEHVESLSVEAHSMKDKALELEHQLENVNNRLEKLREEATTHQHNYPEDISALKDWHDKQTYYEQVLRAGEAKLENIQQEHSALFAKFSELVDSAQSPPPKPYFQKPTVKVRALAKRHIDSLAELAGRFNLDLDALVFSASAQYVEEGYTADRVVNMLKKIGERFSPYRLFEPWKAGRVRLV